MGGFVTRQAIRCADELILNKRDLYVAGHWERFKATIVDQNPYARGLGNQPCPGRSLIAARTNDPHVAGANGECGIRSAAIIHDEQHGHRIIQSPRRFGCPVR